MPENSFKNSNFDQVFGELQNVFRLKRGCFEKFLIPAIIFGCFLFGVAAYLGSEDWLALPVCALPFLLMFVGLVWHLFATRRNELRIYEHGFTYRNAGKLQACLWKDIKFCHRRERDAREMSEAEWEKFPLGAVEKKSGEMIEFDSNLAGTPEIINQFENFPTRKRTKQPRQKDSA